MVDLSRKLKTQKPTQFNCDRKRKLNKSGKGVWKVEDSLKERNKNFAIDVQLRNKCCAKTNK